MYVTTIPEIAFSPPWDKTFEQRMAMLCQSSPRAAHFYETPDTSTFRYRAYNIWQSLAAEPAGGPSASWFHNHDLDRVERFIDKCDVLVLCRTRYTHQINRMVALARARKRRVLFDVDDLVFDPRYVHIVMDTLQVDLNDPGAFDCWFAYMGRLGGAMDLCDGVVTTNSYLASRAEAFLGKPASIIPNYLNREQMEVSDAIWNAKDRTGWARDDRIHIGYFSGTPTHNRDFAVVARALARLMDDNAHVILRVVGFLDNLDPELERHRSRIEIIPLQDFVNLQREIGRVEINLVPLQDNVFTNCKSELKWFEAAIVGAVTIASPTHTYRSAIRHGQNGWLAPAYAWEEVLREVIDGGPMLWRAVAERAHGDVIARYSWRNQAAIIRAAFFDRLYAQRQREPLPDRIIHTASNASAAHTKFEEQAYLNANPDVAKAVAEGRLTSGRSHYDTWGRNECRPLRSRSDEVLKHVSRSMRGIEIGAYFNPLAAKAAGYNCLAMDIFSTDQLRHIAEGDKNIPKELITNIEAVDIIGSASEIGDIVPARYGSASFDYIISSHNFEHLPNPIRFLQGCDRILKIDGYLSMALPDLRCCFDYFRWPTILTEWLEAFFQNRDRPTMSQLFTHIALHSRARIGDTEKYSFDLATRRDLIEPESTLLEAYQGWSAHNESPDSAYHDVHCSAFTPASFQLLICELNFLGLTDLQCVEVRGPSGNEFYVHLQRKRKREPSGQNECDELTKGFYRQRTALMRQVIAETARKAPDK